MNKNKTLFKTMLPILGLTLVSGTGIGLVSLTSCTAATTTQYKLDGTNWDGYISGSLRINTNDNNHTATIINSTDYCANNLVIPNIVTDANGVEYAVSVISSNAFQNCLGLTGSLTISSGIEHIGTNAFYRCSRLNGNLTIPESVIAIDSGAFLECSGLTGGLTIPYGVIQIGTNAFKGCFAFTGSLTISSSVTIIGTNTFQNCANFSNISLVNFGSLPGWGNSIFQGWSAEGTVSTIHSTLTSQAALAYLITLGLPNSWSSSAT